MIVGLTKLSIFVSYIVKGWSHGIFAYLSTPVDSYLHCVRIVAFSLATVFLAVGLWFLLIYVFALNVLCFKMVLAPSCEIMLLDMPLQYGIFFSHPLHIMQPDTSVFPVDWFFISHCCQPRARVMVFYIKYIFVNLNQVDQWVTLLCLVNVGGWSCSPDVFEIKVL